jgi:hypothetical protein
MRLGGSYSVIEDTVSSLQLEYQGVVLDWMYSKTSGWYIVCNKRKKRLFYLLPADGDFTFKIVFNDKSLELIKGATFPKYISAMLREAKKYPEGTLLVFDASNFNVQTILGLLRAKISG